MEVTNAYLTNLEAARKLAAAGIPVFPAAVYQQDGSDAWHKKPLISDWQNRATTDQEQIEQWWQQHPAAQPGIELGRAGLVVLDGDRHGGPDGVEALNDVLGPEVPPHPVSLTAGGGTHHIFRQPPEGAPLTNRKGSLPPGVDVRGQGGWIVAPGSVRSDGKCYEQQPGAPSLVEAFQNGTIPTVPAHVVELIARSPSLARTTTVPAAPAETLRLRDRIAPRPPAPLEIANGPTPDNSSMERALTLREQHPASATTP